MLKLGGLENSAPNTSQSSGKFKVAKNVCLTKDGFITPRPSMEGFTGDADPAGLPIIRWTHFSSYTDATTKQISPIKIGVSDQGGLGFVWMFKGSSLVPVYNALNNSYTPTMVPPTGANNNFSDQSVELFGTKYILNQPNTSLRKLVSYDGYEANSAGTESAYFYPFQVSKTTPGWKTNGSRYVKVLPHFMDMNGKTSTGDAVTYSTDGVNKSFNCMISGQNASGRRMVVGVGENGAIGYSYDGQTWNCNTRSNPLGVFTLSSVAFGTPGGGKRWVAVCSDISLTQYPVIISDDGINWRRVEDSSLAAIGGGWTSIVWGGDKFVAVRSLTGTASQRIMTSPDGITWTYRTAPAANNWKSVAYGGSATIKFVAVATTGLTTDQIMTSPDGITWTARTSVAANIWNSVTWGNGSTGQRWVAVAENGTTANQVMTSADGITWTARTISATNTWNSICFGQNIALGLSTGFFVAIAKNTTSTTNKVMTSVDGITWTLRNFSTLMFNTSICYYVPADFSTGIFITSATFSLSTPANKLLSYVLENTATWTWTDVDVPLGTDLYLSPSDSNYRSFILNTSNSSPYLDFFNNAQNMHFYGRASYNAGTDEFDLSISEGTYNWGNWTPAQDMYVIRVVSLIYNNVKYSAIAYKIKSITPSKFYGNIRLYDSVSLTWVDVNAALVPEASGIFSASRLHFTVWCSPSEFGVYYYRGLVTSGQLFTSPETVFTIDITQSNIENSFEKSIDLPFPFAGPLNLNYDIESTVYNFNSLDNADNPFVAITTYQNQLILADSDNIYFSDGINISMSNADGQLSVGNTEHGKITAIAGTKDYLIVSRERRVYMIAGTLATGQIREQEIPGIMVGAYSNSCLLEVEGDVILLSSVGMWRINGSNAKKLSSGIELNFKTLMKRYINQQPSAEASSITFNMNNYPVNAYRDTGTLSSNFITSAYDAYRGLVVFTDSSISKCGQSLVLHTQSNEFTNWESFDTDGYRTTAMTFIDGQMYVGTMSDTFIARTSSEVLNDNVFTYDYSTRSPSKLITNWITAGEPSLEKQVLQLKMFGYIWSDLAIKHYQNWDLSTVITDTTYTSPGDTSPKNYIMYHKQRLNSSKAMAFAIEIGMKPNGKSFWIEGLEVEFEAIQVGMKR